MMGTFHGVAETGMDPETWRKGILDALQKMTVGGLEAGFEWAIMGAAIGGPLALAGKGITRLQVRGMTKNLHARGISESLTTRLTPEEIVCTKWAYDLAEAGSAAEGKLLLKTVTKELGAEDAAALAEGMERMGKPKAKTELPGVEPTGESAEGAGSKHLDSREGYPSKPEKELIGQSHSEIELLGGHKIVETAEHECYLCSEECVKITEFIEKYRLHLEDNPSVKERLRELGDKWNEAFAMENLDLDRSFELLAEFKSGMKELGEEMDLVINQKNIELPDGAVIQPWEGDKSTFEFFDIEQGKALGSAQVDELGNITFDIDRVGVPGTKFSGTQVGLSLAENFRLRGIKFNGVNGVWGGKSTNLEIFEGLEKRDDIVAFCLREKNFTTRLAEKLEFKSIKLESKVPDRELAPYTRIKVIFY